MFRSNNSSSNVLPVFSTVSNNAGVMAPPFKLSKDNIELQFATNHLGIFPIFHIL